MKESPSGKLAGYGTDPDGNSNTWRRDPVTGAKVWAVDREPTLRDLKYGNGDSYSWATEADEE